LDRCSAIEYTVANDTSIEDVQGIVHKCETAFWVPEDAGMVVIPGKQSEKLEIARRIEPDQCYSAPQMDSTNKEPQGVVHNLGNLFPLVTRGSGDETSVPLQYFPPSPWIFY
jgi:hypothetical protein